ncbi:hypothetical protein OHN37_04995 [Streptomyces sp. NBC_00485]|uniref:hypothetical protein n=1 Tax=Streptomyces sp. NBC_00485 TaxID=2975758 RepID=UPI002E17FA6E
MDHFERELARMMRDTQEHTPFEAEQQVRLRSGVRARRRARAVQKATGSVLAAAGLAVGFFMLPHDPGENRPQAPLPRPVMSPSQSPTLTPDMSPSATSTASPTGTAGEPPAATTTPTTPTTTGTSDAVSLDPSSTGTQVPPSGTATPSAPPTPSSTLSSAAASEEATSLDSG